MYQVKLFYGTLIGEVQEEVNAWLSAHKDISITHSSINTISQPDMPPAAFTFYVLYTSAEARIEELKEIAAEADAASSVEVADINPEVLKPSN